MTTHTPLRAFTAHGIEIEYMIVGCDDLEPLPIADALLRAEAGKSAASASRGALAWSNEMMKHLIEVKNDPPRLSLSHLGDEFDCEVRYINSKLKPLNAQLMPTAMHPWMDPSRDAFLWSTQNGEIYRAYERIFNTKSHGWANLQSMHINLPFADDAEFERLHAAIRLIVPIIPALAASSPIAERSFTGFADYRMEAYRTNSQEFKSITGDVVPETVSSRREYEDTILAPMYGEIRSVDPTGILQHEWLNSRGAIARFDRNAIEIRVCDTQECARADIAIAAAVAGAVRTLYASDPRDLMAQQSIETARLAQIFASCVRNADRAVIDDDGYLDVLRAPARPCRASVLWSFLIEASSRHVDDEKILRDLRAILEHGPLARRILRAVGDDYSRAHLQDVYQALCDCLQRGALFLR